MSYVILLPPPPGVLPTLISVQDIKYPELVCAGYVEIDRGWKWEMQDRMEKMTYLICETLI